MTAWLVDTLVWTGALIALVLVCRRPVARMFGPGMAYALWALPMARLLLPPIRLPAWLAPAEPAPEPAISALDPARYQSAAFIAPAPEEPAPLHAFDWDMLASAALALWLAGATLFLIVRFRHYFALRSELVAEAREMGRARGPLASIRLIETPGTPAPLAFGVLDPVVALPPGFMALTDRTARDLALEHEFAHHRGFDLLINVLVQPLFALHWWNPLGRYGWLALRRDQEAACDARVMAARGREERAAYASLIASFAAGPDIAPRAAIAAPMACPVLGEQSIIHRLRSLAMSDLSPRRRLAGRLVLGTGLLALPLTASISYAGPAQPEAPEAPEPPAMLEDVPQPPAPPAPPEAPLPPDADAIETVDPDSASPQVRYSEESEYVTIVERDEPGADGKRRKVVVKRVTGGDGSEVHEGERTIVFENRTKVIHGRRGESALSDDEIEEIMIEVREGLAEADQALKELPRTLAEVERETSTTHRTIIKRTCTPGSSEVATTSTEANGLTVVNFCQAHAMKEALEGIREARRSIEQDGEMPASVRKRVLKELDRQIAAWSDVEA